MPHNHLLTQMSITRERLTPEESRAAALEAARAPADRTGPQAVTLKAVAARDRQDPRQPAPPFRIGGRPAGGAGRPDQRPGLRRHRRGGAARPRPARPIRCEIVDRTFDAFGREGAGALAAWMILSGNRDALNPILDAIHGLVDQLARGP